MIPRALQEWLAKFSLPWSPMLFKASLVGMLAAAVVIPLALVTVPFIEFFNGMAAQPKGKAQMTYGRVYGEYFLVEQEPVAGTLPRGFMPYPFDHLGATIEEAQEVGSQFSSPLPVNRENIKRGREVFTIFCAACHGPKGMGDGPVTGPNRFPAPPSLHTDQARAYVDGTVFHVITKGVGKMPGLAGKIRQDDRWRVIQYLHALQRSVNPHPEDLDS